jgi:hypothetical protein
MASSLHLRPFVEAGLRSKCVKHRFRVSDWLIENLIDGEVWRQVFLNGERLQSEENHHVRVLGTTIINQVLLKIRDYAALDRATGFYGDLSINSESPWPDCFSLGMKTFLAIGDHAARRACSVLKYRFRRSSNSIETLVDLQSLKVCSNLSDQLCRLLVRRSGTSHSPEQLTSSSSDLEGRNVGYVAGVVKHRILIAVARELYRERRIRYFVSGEDEALSWAEAMYGVAAGSLTEAQVLDAVKAIRMQVAQMKSEINRAIIEATLDGKSTHEISENETIRSAIIKDALKRGKKPELDEDDSEGPKKPVIDVRRSIDIRKGFVLKSLEEFGKRNGFVD